MSVSGHGSRNRPGKGGRHAPGDRRVARTRALLEQAFLTLIAKQPYESIGITDICAAANVGRSTFYLHYAGKDDLKRRGLDHLRRELTAHQEHTPAGHGGDGLLAFSLPLFEHAHARIDLYRALTGGRGSAIALDTIRRMLSDLVRKSLAEGADMPGRQDMPREFIVQFVVGACISVLTWWLDRGAKLTPRQVDAMFRSLAIEGLRATA